MRKSFSLLSILLLISIASCNSSKGTAEIVSNEVSGLSPLEERLVDSILQWGLDHEALYTIFTDIKPMSSVSGYSLVADTVKEVEGKFSFSPSGSESGDIDGLYNYQKMVNELNQLNIPDVEFTLVPNSWLGGNMRYIQLNVVRRSVLDKVLADKKSFFGPLGLVPGASPLVVVTTVENLPRDKRDRGYGYLYGFPDYAVEFFIKAEIEKEQTGKFVERNFFHIPVYDSIGSFVYAYPKDYTPTIETDSILYYKSAKILDNYKSVRRKYLRSDSTLKASQLLKDFYSKSAK